MRLIANKPCSFGGRKFYIGDEVPTELVADPKVQERLGVIAIANTDKEGVPDGQSGTFFTQEQIDKMIAEAIEEAVNNTFSEMQQAAGELKETEQGAYEGTVLIMVKGSSSGENEQLTAITATPEEIQKAFSIMQLTAEEGAKEIAGVKSENVLILLHAADSRKTIKDAAKKRADNLFPADGDQNLTAGTDMEGADT